MSIYDEITNKKNEFINKYSLEPNTLYIGKKKINDIPSQPGILFFSDNPKLLSYMGMDVVEAKDDKHMSVGLEVKEEVEIITTPMDIQVK